MEKYKATISQEYTFYKSYVGASEQLRTINIDVAGDGHTSVSYRDMIFNSQSIEFKTAYETRPTNTPPYITITDVLIPLTVIGKNTL